MWKDPEFVQVVSKRATWWAVLLAFLSGIAGLLTTAYPSLQALVIASVIFAFLSATAGFVVLIADKRKGQLENDFKRTRPEMEVAIVPGQKNGDFFVLIKPHNNIPFEERWVIVTLNNAIISGIPLGWVKIVPHAECPYFLEKADMNLSKVRDNYIELRFDYRSIFAADLPKLTLGG